MLRIRLWLLAAAVVALLLAPPAARANVIGFDLNLPSEEFSGFTGPFIHLDVSASGGEATITVTSLTSGGFTYLMGGVKALDFNFSQALSSLTVDRVANTSSQSPPFSPGPFTVALNLAKGSQVDIFGRFNTTIRSFDSCRHSFSTMTLTAVPQEGGFAEAQSVFSLNARGFGVAAHVIAWDGNFTGGLSPTGFVSAAVPVPPTVFLMASGLLGLAWLRLRRKS